MTIYFFTILLKNSSLVPEYTFESVEQEFVFHFSGTHEFWIVRAFVYSVLLIYFCSPFVKCYVQLDRVWFVFGESKLSVNNKTRGEIVDSHCFREF
jgi:hypothetical protein